MNKVQCGRCFQMVDIYPGESSIHKCNGKDRRVYVGFQDQPFYKELRFTAPTSNTEEKE